MESFKILLELEAKYGTTLQYPSTINQLIDYYKQVVTFYTTSYDNVWFTIIIYSDICIVKN